MVFKTEVCAKWILAGEHAVLRGSPALVFPLKGKKLIWNYTPGESPLEVQFAGDYGQELSVVFWGVFEKALEFIHKRRSDLKGQLYLTNHVPIGTGLGFSAVLCVAFAQWLHHQQNISDEQIYDFARNLENLFHGESSGVDIAVALSGQPLHFERSGQRLPFQPQWQPQWFLSYTGQRAMTGDCVQKVKNLIAQNSKLGTTLDLRMKESVQMAEIALLKASSAEGFSLLARAIDQASSCFVQWGLVEGRVAQHLQWLRDKGAVAVKPTGSGDGGYALSLWQSEPPSEVRSELISCN